MKNFEDLYQFVVKIVIPATVGVSLKVAIQMRKEKISFINVVLSFVVGIASAYLFSSIIDNNVPKDYQSIAIAIVAISGEKIGEWLVYRMNIDGFLQAILDAFKDTIIKLIR